jgi:hypothetical protein
MSYKHSILGLTLVLTGCVSTSNVLELGRDTYSVSATADGFRDAASARQNAFESGAKKCASLGKKFMLTNENVANTRMGIDTTVSIVFRCLSETDHDYSRPEYQKSADLVIENR